jgi:hypothetical protein
MADDYTVENGVIQNPGKFEGEPEYAPYFYDLMLNGASSETLYEDDRLVDVFVVDADDRAQFPELADAYAVLVWEDDQGFFNTREMTEQQLDNYRAELENSEPTEPEEEDITTEDHEKFYQSGRLVIEQDRRRNEIDPRPRFLLTLGKGQQRYIDTDDYRVAVRLYMELTKFWPNVWFISDHGNAHLLTITEDN